MPGKTRDLSKPWPEGHTLTPMERSVTSFDAKTGRCALFDGETTCPLKPGHDGPHRFYDPTYRGSGPTPFVEKNDFGLTVEQMKAYELEVWGGPKQPSVVVVDEFDEYAATPREEKAAALAAGRPFTDPTGLTEAGFDTNVRSVLVEAATLLPADHPMPRSFIDLPLPDPTAEEAPVTQPEQPEQTDGQRLAEHVAAEARAADDLAGDVAAVVAEHQAEQLAHGRIVDDETAADEVVEQPSWADRGTTGTPVAVVTLDPDDVTIEGNSIDGSAAQIIRVAAQPPAARLITGRRSFEIVTPALEADADAFTAWLAGRRVLSRMDLCYVEGWSSEREGDLVPVHAARMVGLNPKPTAVQLVLEHPITVTPVELGLTDEQAAALNRPHSEAELAAGPY